MPGIAPAASINFTSGVPSLAFGRAKEELAVIAATVSGRFRPDRVEALLDGAGRLVGRKNAAAGRDHGLGHLVKLSEVHSLLRRV
jgi:hypothetical protein